MSQVDSPRPSKAMPQIPLEVQLKIAENLETIQCGRNVSLVCKSLRNAGEMKVWQTIDLTSGWDSEWEEWWVEADFLVDDGNTLTPDILTARASIVGLRLQNVLAGIAAYPSRAKAIRFIRLEPSDGNDGSRARSLFDFLQSIALQITHLSILPLTVQPADIPALGCTQFLSSLDSDLITFPKVTEVQFRRGTKTLGPLPTWILHITPLQRLEFSIDEIDLSASFSNLDESITDHMFSRIKSFTVNQVNADHYRHGRIILSQLLGLAPGLGYVKITGDCEPDPDEASPVQGRSKRSDTIMVLHLGGNYSDDYDDYHGSDDGEDDEGEAEKDQSPLIQDRDDAGKGDGVEEDTKDFENDSDDDFGHEEFGGWDALMPREEVDPEIEDHGFGPGIMPMDLQHAVVEVKIRENTGKFEYEDIIVPRDTTLCGLAVLTIPRPPFLESISLPIDTTLTETGYLSSKFIRQLRKAPNLDEISLPYSQAPFPADFAPHSLDVGHHIMDHAWVEEGHRGAIINHFAKGGTTQEIGFELWHVRMLTKVPDDSVYPAHGKRLWRDLVRYKGKTVPRDILEAAYEKAGVNFKSNLGGRFRELGRGYKAWYFLERWRDEAGEREDEDDRLSDASFE